VVYLVKEKSERVGTGVWEFINQPLVENIFNLSYLFFVGTIVIRKVSKLTFLGGEMLWQSVFLYDRLACVSAKLSGSNL
jgi:hypothetical protein